MNTVIIGAGPAGLACAKSLYTKGHNVTVIDKRPYIGGLCSSFKINNFIFDRFVHFSFSQDKEIISLFNRSCNNEVREFKPSVYNLYHNKFIMHPVQNNLNSLGIVKGLNYLFSYLKRNKDNIQNYYDWLCASYGKKFADDFPYLYTLKYWCTDPFNMETKWIGPRMSDISLKDFLISIFSKNEHLNYYHKTQRYPLFGGYNNFLKDLYDDYNVLLDEELQHIDLKNKQIITNKDSLSYDEIVYTAPLKELFQYVNNKDIVKPSKQLHHTSGYIVSIGLKKEPKGKGVFFYIYDKDILFARAYYPHLKSKNNAPLNHYSIQLEFYTLDGHILENPYHELKESIEKVLGSLNISKDDVLFCNIQFEKYANILFDHNIYKARDEIYSFAKHNNIYLAGRFGLWNYLWSDQSILSGFKVANNILKES